jgi:hypothetical protein
MDLYTIYGDSTVYEHSDAEGAGYSDQGIHGATHQYDATHAHLVPNAHKHANENEHTRSAK